MSEFISSLFDSKFFMPHGHCYLWRPDILWLNAGSDAVIALAYFTIPFFLVYLVQKRKDLAFNWIFVMFALFILACGTTHVIEIWTIWNPQYALQGVVKFFTASVSFVTALLLIPLMPKAITLPSPRDLEEKSRELEHVNEELRQLNASLESRVEEKTRDLARLAAIVEFSNDAIIGKDNQGTIIAWNPAAERLFGYEANEAIGNSIYSLVPVEHHEDMRQILERVARGEATESHDTIRLTKEGHQIEVSLTISPIKDARGALIGSSSISRDISSRKMMERQLSKSEARKAAILNASLEAIITVDHEGIVVEWNNAAEKTFGYSLDEVLGKDLAELIVPDRFRSAHRKGIAHFNDTGIGPILGKRIEVPGLASGGREIPLELSVTAISIDNGPAMFTASARDITSRLRAEEAAKRNQDKFRRVIEAAPNGLLMVGKDGKITLCNAEIESLFGYSREELIGLEIEHLVPQRFRAEHPGHRIKFFANPETRQMGAGRDLFGLRKDGKEFPIEIGLNPLETEDGTFVLAAIVDISKRKALEARIQKAADSLQHKNIEMEQFVYTVSHDLKSPLVTSTGFLGLLKEDFAAQRYDKVADSIGRLERANTRMSQLIDDLLQLSRIGRIKLVQDEIEVDTMIQSICDGLLPQIKEKKVSIKVQRQMPILIADRKRVYQAFDNLIMNALKYGVDGPNPEIAVIAEERANELCFAVRDNGSGIDPQYHTKIFGLFQRLESDNRGTGVGLTIVSRIMQQHGGRVWVESQPGQGATFWLAFPRKFSPAEDDQDV